MEPKPLTVGRLISYLQNYPKDAILIYEVNGYLGEYRDIKSLSYHHEGDLVRKPNSLVLK